MPPYHLTTTAPLDAIASLLLTIHTSLVRAELTEDALLEDLEVDDLDRAEMAMLIEDMTDAHVLDDEINNWLTLGDVVRTYEGKRVG